MGLFPPGTLKDNEKLSQAEVTSLQSGDKRGMPPISIRNASTVNSSLQKDPLPNGFVSIPVFEFSNNSIDDDIGLGGCDYVDKVDAYNFPNPATYESVDYLVDDLREPIGTAFGLSQTEIDDMQYPELYDYCDVVQSREFEGVSLNYTYTPEQLTQINQTVLNALILPMGTPELCRDMYVSKGIRSFLRQSEAIISGAGPEKNIKYEIFSSHDWSVIQHLLFLDASNGNFTVVPFASSVVYELHSDPGCNDASCYWVEVYFNNLLYRFIGDCGTPGKCTWPEWLQLLEKKGFVSSSSGYVDECATPFTPPTHLRFARSRAEVKRSNY